MSEDRGLLSRWSQRKAAARRGEQPPEPDVEKPVPDELTPNLPAAAEPSPEAPVETTDNDMPTLPSLDDLTAESDYTGFLHEKVPEQLRRAALRKLWASDPVFANLDGLNDYDEDYNLVDTTISAAQTAYRAGRGYVEEIEAKLEQVDRLVGGDKEQERESADDVVAPDSGTNPVGQSDAGNKSADAPQRVAASGASAESDEKCDK